MSFEQKFQYSYSLFGHNIALLILITACCIISTCLSVAGGWSGVFWCWTQVIDRGLAMDGSMPSNCTEQATGPRQLTTPLGGGSFSLRQASSLLQTVCWTAQGERESWEKLFYHALLLLAVWCIQLRVGHDRISLLNIFSN